MGDAVSDRLRRWAPQERISRRPAGEGSSPAAGAYPGIQGLRRVPWGNLPLGAVIVDGPLVSGSLPYELRGFPLVNRGLRDELYRKYHFRDEHLVTIADVADTAAAGRLARDVEELDRRLRAAEPLKQSVTEQWRRWGIDPLAGAFTSPRVTEATRLVKDHYNSFSVNTARPGFIPSLLRSESATDISLAQIVSGLLQGERFIPNDIPVTLHLALDVSFSMKDRGRLSHGQAAVNQLAKRIPAIMRGTAIKGYQYSDEVRRVDPPVTGTAIPNEGTQQAPLIRRVLKHMDRGRHNKLILVTDGEPGDLAETLRTAEKAREAGLDYLQILLHTDDDLRHQVQSRPGEFTVRDNMIDGEVPEGRIIALSEEQIHEKTEGRFNTFTRIAEVAGGNQVVLTEFSALGLVTVELYDRYMGLLTLVG